VSNSYEPSIEVEGSLFEHLGLDDAGELDAKGELLVRLHRVRQSKGLNQSQFAKAVGVTTPSAKADGFCTNARRNRPR
jgi:predicted XRE-type DNA-binding protein